MTSESVFKNNVTLTLKNKRVETDFQSYLNNQRTKYNKWFSVFLLMISLIDIIIQNVLFVQTKEKIPIDIAYIRLYTAFIITPFSFCFFILGLFIKNKNFKIFISYVNYILINFPFTNIKGIVLRLGLLREDILAIVRIAEFLITIVMIMLVLAPFPHGLFLNFILFSLFVAYNCLTREYYFIFYFLVAVIAYILISYFYTKNIKEKFLAESLLKEQMKWYFNLFEHLHSGFISFGNINNKINLINNTLMGMLCRNKEIANILTKEIREEQVQILTTSHIDETAYMNIFKNNSEKVLNILLRDIQNEYKENKEHSDIISISNFDLKQFLKENKSMFINKEINENFLFIGYKDFEVEARSESSENINVSPGKKNEIITLEVYFRCQDSNDTENNQCEILLHDISNIKTLEGKNAELKYKTIFLSKIAHEFKNPLICISELVHDFNQNYAEHVRTSKNIKLRESYKLLKQISSFTDYLLILMKDLDLFARVQIKEEIPFSYSKVDLDDIFESIKELAEILLLKYNKNNDVKFLLENNIPHNIFLVTDEIKFKQILINLISNAIKFTNLGWIKIKTEKLSDENLIKFEVSDTGIGLTNEQMKNLFQPFKIASVKENKYGSGLGLYIVSNIIKQMKTEIFVNSKVGEGTTFSFCLPYQLEEENQSIKTVRLLEQNDPMLFDRTNFHEEEDEGKYSIKLKSRAPSRKSIIQPQLNLANQSLPQSEAQLQETSYKVEQQLLSPPKPDYSYLIVVDDEYFTRKSSIRTLKKSAEKLNKNIEIFDAADGIECLYLIYKYIKVGYKINAIVSDELMNYMNGTLTAENVKKIKNLNTDKIPFFLLTAYPEIQNSFIDHLISKPLTSKDAESIINFATS